MGFIKNYDQLAITDQRKVALELVESAFSSIAPENVLDTSFSLQGSVLTINSQVFDLDNFRRTILIGFGKGSAQICRIIEAKLGERLSFGYDIDVVEDPGFQKLSYTKGTHPLPSEENIKFTQAVLASVEDISKEDLVLVVICGGGSVLFEAPYSVDLTKLKEIVEFMLKSGADITEMNIIRKHLSKVKGGGLAKLLQPASVASLIFSDVPGNDLSVIASGPTVKDNSNLEDVDKILDKYQVKSKVSIPEGSFTQTATEDAVFKDVFNILMLSNKTALIAMEKRALDLGFRPRIFTDSFQGDAKSAGQVLLKEAGKGEIMLAGGETTIKVTGSGKGGRNQALGLYSLDAIDEDTLLVSFDTDGWDFYGFAGVMIDQLTKKKTGDLHLDAKEYKSDDNSYEFFSQTEDGIIIGKLGSNVSDLYIVMRK